MSAGGYSNLVVVGDGNSTITAGLGQSTVQVGNGDNQVNVDGYLNSVLLGRGVSSGNDTVSLGSGSDDTISISHMELTVAGGSNSFVVLAPGGGISQVTDNSNALTVQIGPSSSSLIFNHGADSNFVIDLQGGVGGFTSTADLAAPGVLADNGAGGTTLTLHDGTTVQFSNLTPAALGTSHFRIG